MIFDSYLASGGIPILPKGIDKDIWTWDVPPTAESDVPTDFPDMTMSSRVPLTACQNGEIAFELEHPSTTDGMIRGVFTRCLVDLLYREDLTQITYSALLDLLPPLEHQYPQCAGKNKRRILFNGTVGSYQTKFRQYTREGKYHAKAGDIRGVVEGAPFIQPWRLAFSKLPPFILFHVFCVGGAEMQNLTFQMAQEF